MIGKKSQVKGFDLLFDSGLRHEKRLFRIVPLKEDISHRRYKGQTNWTKILQLIYSLLIST